MPRSSGAASRTGPCWRWDRSRKPWSQRWRMPLFYPVGETAVLDRGTAMKRLRTLAPARLRAHCLAGRRLRERLPQAGDQICSCQPDDTSRANCQQRARDQESTFRFGPRTSKSVRRRWNSQKCNWPEPAHAGGTCGCGIAYTFAPLDAPATRSSNGGSPWAKICVTGAAGFIGDIWPRNCAPGHEVAGLDDFSSGKRENAALLARHPSSRWSRFDRRPDAALRPWQARPGYSTWPRFRRFHSRWPTGADPTRSTWAGTVTSSRSRARRECSACARLLLRRLRRRARAAQARGSGAPADEPVRGAEDRLRAVRADLHARIRPCPAVALRYFNVYGPRQDPKSEVCGGHPALSPPGSPGQRPIVFAMVCRRATSSTSRTWCARTYWRRRATRARARSSTWPGGELVADRPDRHAQAGDRIFRRRPGDRAPGVRAGDLRESSADISKARAVLGYEPRCSSRKGSRECRVLSRVRSSGLSVSSRPAMSAGSGDSNRSSSPLTGCGTVSSLACSALPPESQLRRSRAVSDRRTSRRRPGAVALARRRKISSEGPYSCRPPAGTRLPADARDLVLPAGPRPRI